MRSIRRIGGLAIIALSVALLGSPASAHADDIPVKVVAIAAQGGDSIKLPENSGELSECEPGDVTCEG
ncbi:hypothetical protein ACQEVF_22155 [Nonomuraea polychroma]|uniref:hypothetical protein n=1 Tax=Nonomuraea polychroma TaxID=46176 RepID=UPI003D8FBD25